MKNVRSELTLVTLANASALVAAISKNVIASAVLNNPDASPLTDDIIYDIAQSKLNAAANKFVEAR